MSGMKKIIMIGFVSMAVSATYAMEITTIHILQQSIKNGKSSSEVLTALNKQSNAALSEKQELNFHLTYQLWQVLQEISKDAPKKKQNPARHS